VAKLVQGSFEVIPADLERALGALGGEQRRAAQQLADEGRADPVQLLDKRVVVADREVEALAGEGEQPAASVGVRQRQLDGLVDPPGTSASAGSSRSARLVVSTNSTS
jgi:hypothetical protein